METQIPSGFKLDENGLFYIVDNIPVLICSPIIVTSYYRNEKNEGFGLLLEFDDIDKYHHMYLMPMSLLEQPDSELRSVLVNMGLRLSSNKKTGEYLKKYLKDSRPTTKCRIVPKTGWFNDAFILSNNRVYGESKEYLLLQIPDDSSSYSTSGTLKDWQINIAAHCSGNSRLLFAVSAGFAPPLLNKVRCENFGVHFQGNSSIGKTTLLCASASVWGNANYVQTWRATSNGVEGTAYKHNDTLLPLDEISQVDNRLAGEIAYMLANGIGKQRADKFGGARSRATWRLIFLSSGEVTLSNHIQQANQITRAGQVVRLVDLTADAGCNLGIFENIHHYTNGKELSDSLKSSCNKYYGTASDYFLQKLVGMENDTVNELFINAKKTYSNLLENSANGQCQRVLDHFLLVGVAGELATQFGVTGWEKDAAMQAAITCFKSWLIGRESGSSAHEDIQALEIVSHFLQENEMRFDSFDNVDHYKNYLKPIRCAGYKSNAGDYYIFPKTFTGEICKNIDSRNTENFLNTMGLLFPGNNPNRRTLSKPVHVPTQGKSIRLYHISSKIMDDNEL